MWLTHCMDIPGLCEDCMDASLCCQGHSRRAAALLALKRPLEAVQAADLGLSLVSRPDASGVEVLHQTRRSAQHQLLDRVIKGKWKGSVHPTLGGYEQIFEFGQNPSQVSLQPLRHSCITSSPLNRFML